METIKKIHKINPILNKKGQPIVYLDGVCYYVKYISKERLTNELISSILAQKGHLTTPELELGIDVNKQLTLLSKNFEVPEKEYCSGSVFAPQYYGNPKIFYKIQEYEKFLNQIVEQDAEILLLQLLKMSIFDAFRKEQDRSGKNYYFEKENYNHLILIDHSECFFGNPRYFVQNAQFSFSSNDNTMLPYLKKYKELRELLELYKNINMEDILKELENTYPIFLSSKQKETYKKEVEGPKKVFSNWLKKM